MMKRNARISFYFWVTLVTGIIVEWQGKTVEAAILLATAIIIAVLDVIARDYFDNKY